MFAVNILEQNFENETFLTRVCFSSKETFYVSGKLNTQCKNLRTSEHPYAISELHQDSPNVIVRYETTCNQISGSFFFN